MVDTIEIKQEETTSEKPVEENVTQSKPEGLPEKFNSVGDLAKSYSELDFRAYLPITFIPVGCTKFNNVVLYLSISFSNVICIVRNF